MEEREGAEPELVRLVLAEARGQVHGHAVLAAHGEEGVVLRRQRAAAVGQGIGRELEGCLIAAEDAQRVYGAHDNDEVRR